MGRWLFMLGGLLVWMTHFLGVYAIASTAEVATEASAPAARLAVGAFTAVCALAAAGFGFAGLRRLRRASGEPLERFSATVAALGGGIGAVGIVWQGLPALVGH